MNTATQQADTDLGNGATIDEGDLTAPVDQNPAPAEGDQQTGDDKTATGDQVPGSEDQKTGTSATPDDGTGDFVETDDQKVQDRFNKLTAEKYDWKKRAETAEAALKDKDTVEPDPKPTLADCENDEDKFREALISWEVKQQVGAATADIGKPDPKAEFQQIQQKYDDRRIEYSKTNPTYSQDVQKLPELPVDTFELLIQHENGPALFHHLSKHLDVADQIIGMPFGQAAAKIGELNVSLSAPRTKTPSGAPDPIDDPVNPGGGVTDGDKNPLTAGATFE